MNDIGSVVLEISEREEDDVSGNDPDLGCQRSSSVERGEPERWRGLRRKPGPRVEERDEGDGQRE